MVIMRGLPEPVIQEESEGSKDENLHRAIRLDIKHASSWRVAAEILTTAATHWLKVYFLMF